MDKYTGKPTVIIRPVLGKDDHQLGEVIRSCFRDYGATEEGTVFSDPVIDSLSLSFRMERSAYFVLEAGGEVVGGAGFQPLKGGDAAVCELQKMYIRRDFRGKGWGRALLEKCLAEATLAGFRLCYLESLPELKDALRLYEAAGFSYIPQRMGNTGYFGCTLFMTKSL
jgi:putative acetyltransferase